MPTSPSTTTAWSARSPSGPRTATAVDEARRRIELILDPPTAEVGAVYAGKVVNLTKFGAFVNILPGRDGLLHISKLSPLAGGKRVGQVEDVLTLGQAIEVRVDDIDPQGKVSLSLANVEGSKRRVRETADAPGAERAPPRDASAPATSARPASDAWRRRRRHRTVSFEDSFEAELVAELGDLGPGAPGRFRRRARATARRPPPPALARPGGVEHRSGAARRFAPRRSGVASGSSPRPCPTCARSRSASGSGSGSRDETDDAGRGLALPRAPAVQGHADTLGRRHRRGARRRRRRLQRLHHEGVHDLLRPAARRGPRPRARHPERHHVGPGPAPSDVDAERTVILDEILMHPDESAELVRGALAGVAVPRAPARPRHARDAASVRDTSARRHPGVLRAHYRPSNIVVSAAGDVDHEAIAGASNERFAGPAERRPTERTRPDDQVEPLVVVRRPTEQAHLVIGARSVSRFDEERCAVRCSTTSSVAASRPGCSRRSESSAGSPTRSGRTGRAIRTRDRWASWSAPRPSTSTRCCASSTGELELLAEHGVTDRELAVAKGNLRAEALLACEDSGARMSRIGSAQLLHGEVKTVDQILERIEEVDRRTGPGGGEPLRLVTAHAGRRRAL